ncbi:MAG: hypothetical protein H7336_03620 [Bacteriovorax sp.]|nr:hypothetical protein [Bacteriovorax sp.]
MNKEKYSILRLVIFGVIAFLAAFTAGYYFGKERKSAVVIQSSPEGVASFESTKVSEADSKACNFRIEPGNNNEPKSLNIDKLKLVDIDSYIVIDKKIFYSTGPVYGKPEIGVIDCISAQHKTIVFPEHTEGSYAYGSDYFRIKKVIKEIGSHSYVIEYYYGADIAKIDFKNFEAAANLKTFKYSEKQ